MNKCYYNSGQIQEITSRSLMSIWRWEKAGKFPKRRKFNGRNYWVAQEVDSMMEQNFQEAERQA